MSNKELEVLAVECGTKFATSALQDTNHSDQVMAAWKDFVLVNGIGLLKPNLRDKITSAYYAGITKQQNHERSKSSNE